MIAAANARLLVALAASLAVHGFLIASMTPGRQVVIPAPPLEVVLAREEAAPDVVPVSPTVPDSKHAARRNNERRSAIRDTHPLAQAAEAVPILTQAAPAVPTQQPLDTTIAVTAHERPAPANREPPGPMSREPPAQVDGRADNMRALLEYGRLLSKAIAREQRYPRVARENGWQGTVEVALEVAAGTRLRQVSIVRSSGYSILDQRALEMARAVAPLPPAPEALQRQDFKVRVPITFRLQD